MHHYFLKRSAQVVCVLITTLLMAGPALADPPEGKGKGRGKGHDRSEQRNDDDRDRDHRRGNVVAPSAHFNDQQRGHVRSHFEHDHGRGRCPPGLSKKHNGCMPPGHAKKWKVGAPLPRGVAFYELPPPLVVQIGAPPPGYRYVRVAADILLIAIGTGMVIDAIADLGRI